jgi:hypothetical protein
MGVEQISEDQAAIQFKEVTSLPEGSLGGEVNLCPFFSMSIQKKNNLKILKVNQRKENKKCHPKP